MTTPEIFSGRIRKSELVARISKATGVPEAKLKAMSKAKMLERYAALAWWVPAEAVCSIGNHGVVSYHYSYWYYLTV